MLSRAFDHICMEKARYNFLIIIIIMIMIIIMIIIIIVIILQQILPTTSV